MNMIRKGQVRWLPKDDSAGQAAFIGAPLWADRGVNRWTQGRPLTFAFSTDATQPLRALRTQLQPYPDGGPFTGLPETTAVRDGGSGPRRVLVMPKSAAQRA